MCLAFGLGGLGPGGQCLALASCVRCVSRAQGGARRTAGRRPGPSRAAWRPPSASCRCMPRVPGARAARRTAASRTTTARTEPGATGPHGRITAVRAGASRANREGPTHLAAGNRALCGGHSWHLERADGIRTRIGRRRPYKSVRPYDTGNGPRGISKRMAPERYPWETAAATVRPPKWRGSP